MSRSSIDCDAYARQDIETIAARCRADYATFKRAALVCMLSARRPFEIVGRVVSEVESARTVGDFSRWPSAAQKRGIQWLESAEGRALWHRLANTHSDDAVGALHAAVQCPALGLAKGGFICQMMGINVGCLDTHNVDRYALSRDAMRLRKEGAADTQWRVIGAYVALCQSLGGSVRLWGTWCEYVADLYPDTYADGRDVSARHVAYVDGIPF